MYGSDPNAKKLAEQPHVDRIPNEYLDITGQFSANVYLQVPTSGGELQLWNCEKDQDYTNHSSVTLHPRQGELILINTQKYHAVHTFDEGSRISMQTFIGYRNDSSPLFIWN